MAAAASGRAAQVCIRCREKVVFVTEAFGCICTNCGTIVEEADDLRFDDSALSFGSAPSYNSSSILLGNGRIQREAQRRQVNSYIDEYRPQVDAVIGAILTRYGRLNLQRGVKDLVLQVLGVQGSASRVTAQSSNNVVERDGVPTISEGESSAGVEKRLHGEQAISSLAVAAAFSILKKYDQAVMLEDVCAVVQVASQSQIAGSLQHMERLIGDTALLANSRDSPSIFIAAQISFLVKQIKLKPRSRLGSPLSNLEDESIFDLEEQRFVSEANIESPGFTKLATELCELCSYHGLNNRSLKASVKKDLAVCAWAILLLAMEGSSGRVCNEGKMAKAIVAFKTWHEGRPAGTEAKEGSPVQEDKAARTAMSEVVKKRYVEISRMLTMYLEQLPWLSDERPCTKEKKPSKRKSRGKVADVKQDITSIKPFPRKTVTKHLTDVIALRPHIEVRFSKAEKEWKSMQWSRFSSTEDQFHSIRASIDGQRQIEDEERQYQHQQKKSGIQLSAHEGILKAINDLLSPEDNETSYKAGLSSQLGTSIGPILLELHSLQDMADEVVDTLLFEKGEMESYLRSSEEIGILQALRSDKGEWDAATNSSSGVKRARSEEEQDELNKINFINGKRTKALTEEESARILSLL